MSITLTTTQEEFIQAKLQTGKYRSAEEVLEVALRLLDEYDRTDSEWLNSVRAKIDAAVAVSEHTPPIQAKPLSKGFWSASGKHARLKNETLSHHVLASQDLNEIADYFTSSNIEAGERFFKILRVAVNS
jgi:antitoxin ParD1/3/4